MVGLGAALTAPPDKWWGVVLNAASPLPGRARLWMARRATRWSRSFAIDRLARSAAVSRDPRGPELVARRATSDALGIDELLESAAAGTLTNVRSRDLLSLAWLLCVQYRGARDHQDACTLFDHVRTRDQATRWDERFRQAYAEALLAVGRHEDAHVVVNDMAPGMERHMLSLDARRQWGADPESDMLASLWTGRGMAGVTVRPGESPAFGRLAANGPTIAREGPLVTVVISSYRPDHQLVHAVHSVSEQSWRNLEILVVDDASGPQYAHLYADVAAIDPRVRMHSMASNGGTYAIRNWALDHAQGEFITFHDSDDWMHPERIAVQMDHLRNHPDALHNASRSTRVTERLCFSHTRTLGAPICEPSLLLRREGARATVGYFDTVRKGADAEYRLRLERITRRDTHVCGDAPLTLQLVAGDSLSGTDIVRHWFAPARRVYRSCFEQWHRTASDLRLPADGARPCFAPRAVLGHGSAPDSEVVVVSNWLEYGTWNADCPAASSIVASLIHAGHSVAIADEPALLPLARMRAALSDRTAALLNSGQVQYVDRADLVDDPQQVILAPAGSQTAAELSQTHTVLSYRPGSRRGSQEVTGAALELLAH